jgi:hypothetical protein
MAIKMFKISNATRVKIAMTVMVNNFVDHLPNAILPVKTLGTLPHT